ncbi:MAG: putative glycoside hydrolase [Acutalibacteraceae bacterium]|nr:putative glycoside hydrolase [Acutalibacteraceae bacterium]
MKKVKLKQKLVSLKATPPPKVKKSYYTFSREYPAGNIPIKRRKNIRVKSNFVKYALYTCLFLFICGASFFTVNLGLEFSYKEPPAIQEIAPEGTEKESLIQKGGIKALYMPSARLGDSGYISSLIKEIRKKNGNSVLIEFKTPEGKLNYTSKHEYAIAAKASVFDNDTVRRAIDLFENAGITVIARVYCFEDTLTATAKSKFAVKYMDTDINWLDGKTEEGGKPWLNPFSKKVHSYITSVLTELYKLGVRGFVLESCQFPFEGNAAGATYPYSNSFKSRNSALKALIKKADKALPKDAFILLGTSADNAAEGNPDIYHGSINDAPCNGVAADISERKPEFIIDKKTDYASMLSLYSDISHNYKDKAFVPVVDTSDYTRGFFRAMKRAGYSNFILYNENGEY